MGFRNALNTMGSPNWVRNRVKHGNSGSWLFSGGWGLSFCHIVAVLSTLRMCYASDTEYFCSQCGGVLTINVFWGGHWLIDWLMDSSIQQTFSSILKHPKFHKRKSFLLLFLHNFVFQNEVLFPALGHPVFCAIFTLVPNEIVPNQAPSAASSPGVVGRSLWPGSCSSLSVSVDLNTDGVQGTRAGLVYMVPMDGQAWHVAHLGYLRPNKSFPWPSKSPWLSHFHIWVDAFILAT